MKPSKGTIARTIILVLALVNQVLSICGKAVLPITDAQVEQVTTLIITIVTAVWSWWKNNSFTYAAIEGDAVKDRMKQADVTFEEG